ncbi:hypothetical protein TNIN_61501 [Trichonephila inaurata madagascariensis]|uniref:Uncharacterized protein n=1 Tax=Trichonephila inaurata madagascariensis TaxID=2747483 RepID=A0A8X6XVU7_9ARAC|nr:hypothetical protein TNIN_61501 [Trichonephila inaurata madagascariensis]
MKALDLYSILIWEASSAHYNQVISLKATVKLGLKLSLLASLSEALSYYHQVNIKTMVSFICRYIILFYNTGNIIVGCLKEKHITPVKCPEPFPEEPLRVCIGLLGQRISVLNPRFMLDLEHLRALVDGLYSDA